MLRLLGERYAIMPIISSNAHTGQLPACLAAHAKELALSAGGLGSSSGARGDDCVQSS